MGRAQGAADPGSRGPLDPRVLGLAPVLRTHLIVCGALAVVVAVAVLAQAEALADQLPRLIDGDGSATRPLVVTLVLVAAVRFLVGALTERSATRALVRTRTSVRDRVLDHLARLHPDRRAALGPAAVGTLTTSAVEAVEPWVRAYLPALTVAAVVPLAAGLRILAADRLSAAVILVVIPLVPLFMILIGRLTEARSARQWTALQRLADRFLDLLEGLPTLRLFGRADTQVERIRLVTDRYRQATMGTLRIAFLSALVLELLTTLSVALVAVSLGLRLTLGAIDLPTALIVLLLAPECFLPLRRVSASFHAATAGLDAAVAVEAALCLETRPDGTAAIPPTGSLVARGVALADVDRGPRLEVTDIQVAPGEMVVVTGPSGAGKSTLLDILRGALPPDRGTVELGGVEVGLFPATDRAEIIGWVPQHPLPLGAEVGASARLGSTAATAASVDEALRAVGLQGHRTDAPETLSGGERRRLAVARGLVRAGAGCRFLLLDEPTAQLDDDTAARVRDGLRGAADQGTGIVVATHDAALVAAADRTVVLLPPERVIAPEPAPEPAARWPAPDTTPRSPDTAGADTGATGSPVEATGGALAWLWGAAAGQRVRLLGAVGLGVLTETCTVGLAATAAWLIVRAAEQPSFADLAVAAVGVRAFAVGKSGLRYAERLAAHDATLRLLADLRATVVARLAHLAPTGLPRGGPGEVQSRLVADIDRLQDGFLRVLGPLTSTLVVGLAAAGLAAVLHPSAGLALGAAVVLCGTALPLLDFTSTRRWSRASASARGHLTAAVIDLARGVEELVACGAEPEARARVAATAAAVDRLDRRRAWPSAVILGLAAAAPALGTAAVVAATGAAGPDLSGPVLGVLVLLPLAVLEMLGPLAVCGEVLARVEASAARVVGLLRRPDPVTEPAHPRGVPDGAGLDLDAISVGWPDATAVATGITLQVTEGERVLVTGPSGSGKSTLAATLVRFLEPRAGTVRVGGVDVADLGGDGVRQSVTWCQQDPWFADTTLGDNLRIARPDAADDELWAALETVHLDEWARALPEGLATRLERDASAMSGGERQRLALARALLGAQRAVVLDEPTAHLDQATARAVLDDLLAAAADRAVIVMGHDESTSRITPAHHLLTRAGSPAVWAEDQALARVPR